MRILFQIMQDFGDRQRDQRQVGPVQHAFDIVAGFVEHIAVERPAPDIGTAGPAGAAVCSAAQRHSKRRAEQAEADDRNHGLFGIVHIFFFPESM